MVELTFHQIIKQIANGASLGRDQAERAFQILMNGGATPAQMGGFLMALKMRGETVAEIAGGAYVMRMKSQAFKAPAGTLDTCGTGGDGRGSFNISTTVAFVVAACGVPVAKHGNRAVSSASGSADIFQELGVKPNASVAVLEKCLQEIGLCFLHAAQFHTAMRHVAPIRQELGVRTIFNLLGPLSNPAKPDFQLLGVYDAKLIRPMAEVLHELGCKRAWVVSGGDGLDELTLSGVTKVAALNTGNIEVFEMTPEQAGLESASLEAIRGGDVRHNTQALREVLLGAKNAYRDTVLLNAAAALVIAEKSSSLKEGVAIAREILDNGLAYKKLQQLIEMSHSHE